MRFYLIGLWERGSVTGSEHPLGSLGILAGHNPRVQGPGCSVPEPVLEDVFAASNLVG